VMIRIGREYVRSSKETIYMQDLKLVKLLLPSVQGLETPFGIRTYLK